MIPFRLSYVLSRRQRLAVELMPWLPAVSATLGFGVGAAYLSLYASVWFLLLGALPLVVYRGLFRFAFDVARGANPVDLFVDQTSLEVITAGGRRTLALDGIFQVFRSDDVWTVLHLDGSVLTIPAGAIRDEQIGYLRSFARRTLTERT
ncbi:MAG TPA: hypothetical protein VGE74_15210 [Gemmata sp.]